MLVAFTGHRPSKLGGYNNTNNKYWTVMHQVHDRIERLNEGGSVEIISGMALGVDQWVAEYAIDRGIPLHAYIPFLGQDLAWPEPAQLFYAKLLNRATSIRVVSPGGYAPWKMQVRNQMMVDACSILIAVWDGTTGGTKNCIDYAVSKERCVDYIRI